MGLIFIVWVGCNERNLLTTQGAPMPTDYVCLLESNFTYQDIIDLQKKKQNFNVPRKKNQTSGVWTIHTYFCVCAPWKPSFSCWGTKCSGHLDRRLWCTDFRKVKPCSVCSPSFHNWRLLSATENSFSCVRRCVLLSSTSRVLCCAFLSFLTLLPHGGSSFFLFGLLHPVLGLPLLQPGLDPVSTVHLLTHQCDYLSCCASPAGTRVLI